MDHVEASVISDESGAHRHRVSNVAPLIPFTFFAERLEREARGDIDAQVRRAYALAFSRAPAEHEIAFGRRFIDAHGLAEFCLVLFNLNEFLFVD